LLLCKDTGLHLLQAAVDLALLYDHTRMAAAAVDQDSWQSMMRRVIRPELVKLGLDPNIHEAVFRRISKPAGEHCGRQASYACGRS
jgi:SOS response regulatory protein OraA/RecX